MANFLTNVFGFVVVVVVVVAVNVTVEGHCPVTQWWTAYSFSRYLNFSSTFPCPDP